MNTISNFQASIYILHQCHEKLEIIFFEFCKYPSSGIDSYSNPILPSIRNYIILETASFLDEYENNFLEINDRTKKLLKKGQRPIHPIEKQYWSRIENLHKIIDPLLKVLYRWTEIKKYRNNYVGHGSRATWKDGNRLSISSQECYDAPRNVFEFQIMRDIIHVIFGLIAQEFKLELVEAEFAARTLKPVVNPLKNNTTIDLELSVMMNHVITEIKKQGKDYSLNIPPLQYEGFQSLVLSMTVFNHPLTQLKKDIRERHTEILSRIKQDIVRNELQENVRIQSLTENNVDGKTSIKPHDKQIDL